MERNSHNPVRAAAAEAVGGEGEEGLVEAARLQAGTKAKTSKHGDGNKLLFAQEVVFRRGKRSSWNTRCCLLLELALLPVAFLGSCMRT